jgi:outer membrane immunogenic protein
MKYRVMFATPLGLIPAAAANTANAAPPLPPAIWSGFYVGLNLGAVSQRSAQTTFAPNTAGNNWCLAFDCTLTPSETATGVLGGLQIGYNFQNGAWVYGLEGDIDLSSAEKKRTTTTGAYTWSTKTGIEALSTFRGRIGYSFTPQTMIYATGGLAVGKVRDTFQGDVGYAWSKSMNWRAGWTLGGGIEHKLMGAWSVKGEALFYDLGHESVTTSDGLNTVGIRDHMTGVAARIGINYAFH